MRKTTAGIVFLMILTLMCGTALAQTRVLATTFPVYQIVRNITQNVPDVEVQLMLPAQAGCPHDYALTPQDMSKLAQADILVLNGLGLEAFLGSPSARAQKELHTIDSSKGISGLLPYTDAEAAHEEHEGHHHGGMNPHLFASPRMAAQMTRSIAGQLADLDPANAATYWANAENYARTLDALADEFAALGGKLKNSRIITQHGVFDYLARDMGLDVVAVIQADDTQAPSASDMMKLIKAIRSQHVGAIFTEPQYPDKVAATLKPGSPRQSWTPSPRGRPSHRWTITKKPCAPTCTRWRAPLEPTNAVVFRDVSVRRSGLAILEHVNATVPQGSCTVIVGPNGAGKTTLILALIGEMRHDGDIDVMTGRSGKPLRLGYVPQRISIDRGMPLTVVEFLVMGIQKRPLWLGIRPSLKAHSLELLSMVKAEHLASRRLGDLSGGEMQRVLLALALQQEPELLVLDEPSAGVDFQGEHLFCELLDELRAAKGFTQLMVSHDLGMVFHHATHVICLKRHVFAEGTPDEVLTQENLMALFGMHMGLINPHAPTADQPKDHHA